MSRRTAPVTELAERPEPGPVSRFFDVFHALFGKVTSLVDVLLLLEPGAYTATNAAGGAGTALGFTEVGLDFGDATVNQVRAVVSGANSGAGSVIVTIHDKTNNVELCRVTVTGAVSGCWIGEWTSFVPTGSDQVIEARVIGNGADDPFFYNIHCQGRTLQARA